MKHENLSLTIEEIHEIRAEHYEKTKNMSFEEYHADMAQDIMPILKRLETLKRAQQGQ